jgi:hypothetical protein
MAEDGVPEIVEENGERWLVTGKYKTRVVDGYKELETRRQKISEYEREYGCSSEEMLRRVKSGEVYETVEIFRWMGAYDDLLFRERMTRTAGTLSTTTETSKRRP